MYFYKRTINIQRNYGQTLTQQLVQKLGAGHRHEPDIEKIIHVANKREPELILLLIFIGSLID